MDPHVVVKAQNTVGESPIWDYRLGRVVWVDVFQPLLHIYNPSTDTHAIHDLPHPATSIGLCEREGYIATFYSSYGHIEPLGSLREPPSFDPTCRFNDGAVSPGGHYFAGTCVEEIDDIFSGKDVGTLYRIDPKGVCHVVEEGVGLSNGIAFYESTCYYVDSKKQTIFAYDYNALSQELTNKRPLIQIPKEEGVPDGLVVDRRGYLWVALWDGWCVNRYAPDGALAQSIHLPTQRPTSMTFGGPTLNTLYITTSQLGVTDQPDAGSLFAIPLDVKGRPELLYAG